MTARLGTRLAPTIGTVAEGAYSLVKVHAGETAKRVVIDVIQSPNNLGRAYFAFEASALSQGITSDGILSDAYRVADGCGQSFRVEPGQELFMAGTANTYVSFHVYEASGDEAGSC